ncbi:MAG: hypothetical protein Q7U97_08200 [Rhodocyclaceae bacterium]|nr:hypothetical protein [Rhodocyclaceae bacterium]
MRSIRQATTWLALAALAACATPEPPAVVAVPAPEPAPAPVAARKPHLESQPLKHLANRKLEPIPDRPLNVRTNCNFRDHTGYRGRLDLQVKDADVRRFRAEVNIPKRGTCRFDLKDFQQAGTSPATLANGADECKVRVWEQENRVTVAFRDCQAQCSGESFDYLWPILVDAKTGKCS